MRRVPAAATALLGVVALYLCCSQCEGMQPTTRNAWKLSGSEMLVQLSFADDKGTNGVYAIDLKEKDPRPKLLIKGGERPIWSPKRNYFAYIAGRYLWLAQKDGSAYELDDSYVFNLDATEPPVHWCSNESLTIRRRMESIGTFAYLLNDADALPANAHDWDRLGPISKIMPMPYPVKDPNMRIKWDDIQAARSLDVSPDGEHLCMEVSPLAPSDLKRDDAKIYVCDRGRYTDDDLMQFPASSIVLHNRRRLTTSIDGVCELNPMWSPRGDWIAFTVVDFTKGYVAPAVCRPDGTQYTELLVEDARRYTSFLPDKWNRVATTPLAAEPYARGMTPTSMWGAPHITPVEWADDGSHLLLNAGDRFMALQVAQCSERGVWTIGNAGGLMGGRLDLACLGPLPLGPSGGGPCLVACSANESVLVTSLARSGRSPQRDTRYIWMPRGATLRWMDW